MNDTMKAITIGVIIVALYIFLRHGKTTQNGPGTNMQIPPGPVIEVTPCGTPIAMEAKTCAIPLAADYIAIQRYNYNPATAPISTRAPFAQPVDYQTTGVMALGPVNVPYGVLGGAVTPSPNPPAPCAFRPLCCVFTGSESCMIAKV